MLALKVEEGARNQEPERTKRPHPHLGGGPGRPVSDPQAGDRFVLFQATHFVVICYGSDRKLNIYQD